MNEIVADGAWCWFGDPRAVHHNGFLYYGWVNSKGAIWVGQTDSATWTRRRTLISPDTHVDDHNNPSILIRGNRVVVFWCGHGGGSMRYRVATNTNSIDGFGATVTCSAGNTPGTNGFTYPNPVQMAHGNAAWLFWRGGNFQPTYSRSTNVTANSWQPAQHLFAAATGQRPYVKVRGNGDSVIHFAMTDGHPHNVATSIYYVAWHIDDNTFRRADGALIGSAATLPRAVSTLERVYDGSGDPRAWTWDLQLDPAGRPHIAFSVLHAREDHDYHVARHDGTAWTVAKVCDAGGTIAQNGERFYSGGIALDPLDLDTVAVARPAGPQELHRIERWETTDGGGGGWALADTVSDADQQNARPCFVRGAPAGMNWRLMWLRGTYTEFTRYQLRVVGTR